MLERDSCFERGLTLQIVDGWHIWEISLWTTATIGQMYKSVVVFALSETKLLVVDGLNQYGLLLQFDLGDMQTCVIALVDGGNKSSLLSS